MRLAELVETSTQVGSTRRRKEKAARLAECLRAMRPEELNFGASALAGLLSTGKIGLGYAKISSARDVPPAEAANLELLEVQACLTHIRDEAGAGANHRRMAALRQLLGRATSAEQAFISRLVVGELRHGALEGSVVDAIALAFEIDAAWVRRAQMLTADLGAVAHVARTEGEAGLRRYDISVLSPVQPMLAHTAQTVHEALERLGRAALELKLDGARVQVHKSGAEVRVFSRRLNDVTAAVPEIVQAVRALPARDLVLDGETIALDADARPLPFQVTMRRFGRKLDVEAQREKLPLSTFFFDCLLVDDQSLLDAPGHTRFEAMQSLLPNANLVPRLVTEDAGAARGFLDRAFERGHEGAMAKALDAPYAAGSRGKSWLKLKQAHTFDLVVLAAEWGSGRRKGKLSNLHLGALDPASGRFVMVGKTFKGLSDALLAWQTEALLAREVERTEHVVHVRPELVVEIAISDVQTSPHYPGGIALRFARVRGYREDKPAAEADTLDALRALHVPT